MLMLPVHNDSRRTTLHERIFACYTLMMGKAVNVNVLPAENSCKLSSFIKKDIRI